MAIPRPTLLLLALTAAGCSELPIRPADAPPAFVVRSIAIPDAPPEGVFMDYLAFDRTQHRLWVPAGNTGCVDVVNVGDDRVERIAGFSTATVERHGVTRRVGPSSATVGEGVVYVGNRADSSVCAVGAQSLQVGACVTLDTPPDGLAYVRATHEVWATTPRAHSITVMAADGGTLRVAGTIPLDGQPEGFAVDDGRGVFYTNLEDRNRTLVLDLKRRSVVATWAPGCGADGPRSLSLDARLNFLLVACTDRVVVLDAGHDGQPLSVLETGGGLDNIDYVESRRELYAAAARAATLTIAGLDARGALSTRAVVATVPGARCAVAAGDGTAYVADSSEGKLLVVQPSR